VGGGLNVYMFSPARIWYALTLLFRDPRYFQCRIEVIWYQLWNRSAPWLTKESIDFMQRYLRRDMQGLEWGSGRSTKWLAKRLGKLTSVEDDAAYFQKVRSQLAGLPVDYRFAPREAGSAGYVRVVELFADGELDFALIDGNYRNSCIAAIPPKIRVNGVVIIDNADQPYLDTTPLSGFRRIPTDNGVWRTDIYIKQ
jgi:hypothetical protein